MSAQVARRPQTAAAQRARKEGVLVHHSPTQRKGIADALVIKDGDVFFLCAPDGGVPLGGDHGLGLYHDDCRFLRGYELQVGKQPPLGLAASARAGDAMRIEMTNAPIGDGDGAIGREQLALTWNRSIDGRAKELHDRITVENHGAEQAQVDLDIELDAAFDDVFVVRGLIDLHPGTVHKPAWRHGALVLAYDGRDGQRRTTSVRPDPAPDHHEGSRLTWRLELGPQSHREIEITITLAIDPSDDAPKHDGGGHASEVAVRLAEVRSGPAGRGATTAGSSPADRFTVVDTDSPVLNEVLSRALRDLQILRSDNAGAEYFAAGVPWFVALFGRDSAITALETLAWDPFVAEQTLRVLAAWQGRLDDSYRDEQPGRILHELRVGELARVEAVPHSPLYASVDSTPLFCILLARHARWTGRLDVFRDLRAHADAALAWMDRAADDRGFIAYGGDDGEHELVNQGWKDSGSAIVTEDGSLAKPPIALVEVQAYAWAARTELADLFERTGEPQRAADLRRQADQLLRTFEERFWMPDRHTYALALQRGARQARVVTSNPGHALWAGVASKEHAQGVHDSLLGDSMFSGWGVRTLSRAERRYNPVGYHLGTVWPHDNAIIAAGLHRYGFDASVARITDAMIDAAAAFRERRLPEVFAGDDRSSFDEPVRYPVACHPQAWAAGSVPLMLTSLLGLEADGFANELTIARPALPAMATRLELRGLRVGDGECDLAFRRDDDGDVHVDVLRRTGDLHITGAALANA